MKNTGIKKILAAIASSAIVISAASALVNAEPDLPGDETDSSGYETTVPGSETTTPEGDVAILPLSSDTEQSDDDIMLLADPAPNGYVALNDFSDEYFREYLKYAENGKYYESLFDAVKISAVMDIQINTAAISQNSNYAKIKSLEGIEKLTALTSISCNFTALERFDLHGHPTLTSIDLNNSPNLTTVNISDCQYLNDINMQWCDALNSVNLTSMNNLKSLVVFSSHFKDFENTFTFDDIVIKSLTELNVGNTGIKTLDTSKFTNLEKLRCYENDLTALDLSNNQELTTLDCHTNQLASLDLSNNQKLTTLKCQENQLASLNVSQNAALTMLDCSSNHIVSLDLDKSSSSLTMENFKSENNTYDMGEIEDGDDFLAKLIKYDQSFNPYMVKNWGNNAKFDENSGKLTILPGSSSIQYEYKCNTDGSLTFQPTISFKMVTHSGDCHIDIENGNSVVEFDKILTKNSNLNGLPSGDYYLTGPLDLSGETITINAGSNVNLCLNGYELKVKEINVYGGTLSIFDCKGKNDDRDNDGCILLHTNINVKDNSKLNLYAGNIEHNVDGSDSDGVILGYNILNDNFNNYFNMYGGKISGFSNGVSFKYNSYSTNYTNSFCMFGGEISRNNNNGVYVNGSNNSGTYSGKFEMSGGRITGNGGNSTGYDENNNGVYVSGGQFTMSGGEISGNNNNGVYVSGSQFIMNNGEISQNKNNGVRNSGNFTMNNGKIINNAECGISANSNFGFVGGTISGSKIGISASYGNNCSMTGGTISDCTTGLEINSGSLNMTGRTISGCTTGLEINGGRLNMYGGTITGNTTGALLNDGIFYMTAGEITGNGKGVDFGANSSATFEVTERPVIFGNNTSGKEVNVYLPQGQYIRILSGVRDVAKIGFTTEEKPTVIPSKEKVYAAKYPSESYVPDTNLYVISDDKNYESKSNETAPYDVYIEAPKGYLTVTNTVTGEDGKALPFTFELSLGDTSITGTVKDENGNDIEFKAGKTTFDLKHGESITIPLPANVKYIVDEIEDNGYIVSSTGAEGTISEAGTSVAEFTNYKGPSGTLTVSKKVTGTGGDKTKPFTFTVSFSSNGEENTVKFTLKDGEHRNITLPAGAEYTVTESDNEGYEVTATGDEGTISQDETIKADFTNHKDKAGNLTISKTVTGEGGETDKEFTFTVTLSGTGTGFESVSGTSISGDFPAEKNGDAILLKFTNGVSDEFTLKHGESLTVTLPAGLTYTVAEDSTSSNGYTVTSTGATGNIIENGDHKAEFTNNKDKAQEPAPGGDDKKPDPTPDSDPPSSGSSNPPSNPPKGEDISSGAGIFDEGELLEVSPFGGISAIVPIIAVLAVILRKRSKTGR